MKWIAEHFQLVVLIVGAFLYWLKEFAETKLAEKQAREAVPDSESADDLTWEDEAPQVPLPAPLPPRDPGYEHAVAQETAAADRHREKLAAHLRRLRETKATTSGGAAVTRARVTAKSGTTAAAAAPASLLSRLRDPSEIRRAMVMREILDPPVALR